MAEIKLVIRIPEKEYNMIKENDCGLFNGRIYHMIRNGTPLPKGHGRLGDLGKIYVELNEAQIEGTEEYKGLGKAKQIVQDAKSIIEADKEREE